MSSPNSCFVFLVLFLLLQGLLPFFAHGSTKVHIVYMGERKLGNHIHVQDSHHQMLADLFGSKEAARESILYSYKHGFSGFAAILTKSQAKLLSDFPEVVGVFPNKILHVQTTRSWDFLNVKPQQPTGILSKALSGAGTIIGVIDTGIWPESKSFSDDGMESVPSRWRGVCQGGDKFKKSNCNNKIIGARWYIKGYEAEMGPLNTTSQTEFLSPRDAVGHGTHTASTAAGYYVKNTGFATLANGLARGGAPSAHLAIYKACWVDGTCGAADVLAAFDDAISDGVDVLSVSLGSPFPLQDYFSDAIAIGSFHAVVKEITVVSAAGNSGPYPQTVTGVAPWLVTVAASTIDRAFPAGITWETTTLFGVIELQGQSLLVGKDLNKFHRLVYGGDIAISAGGIHCDTGSLDASLAKGNVVLCFQSKSQRSWTDAFKTVRKAKGLGLIFAQYPNKDVSSITTFPIVLVDYTTGTTVLNYIDSASQAVVKFRPIKPTLGHQVSPEVAFFSSRCPSSLFPHVLKPDIAAPGVNILAAWSPISISDPIPGGLPPQNFRIVSGTSMACPRVAGVAALLKTIHPTWTPAAIKSAIITTASIKDEYGQRVVAEGLPPKEADPFDYGGGHIEPNKAVNPGLIYDIKPLDYVQFFCSSGLSNSAIRNMYMTKSKIKCRKEKNFLQNLNMPSISIPELKKSTTVSRTVTNVGPIVSVYKARVEAPPGVSVKVDPSVLAFNSTSRKLTFEATFVSKLRVHGRYSFGYLYWEDGLHSVRTPLVVRSLVEDFYSVT